MKNMMALEAVSNQQEGCVKAGLSGLRPFLNAPYSTQQGNNGSHLPSRPQIHVEPVNYLSKPQKERHPVRASSTLPLATKGSPKLRSWSKHGLWWFSALRAKKRQ